MSKSEKMGKMGLLLRLPRILENFLVEILSESDLGRLEVLFCRFFMLANFLEKSYYFTYIL